jgi:hypothetical protein
MSSPARVGFVTQLPNSGGGPGDRLSGAESGESMLNALLDDGPDLAPAQADDNRPDGRESAVRGGDRPGAFRTGALVRNGAVRLRKSLSTIEIPSTVQAVLASRILLCIDNCGRIRG